MSEHFGSLALPVGEFLALEHGTEYHGCGNRDYALLFPTGTLSGTACCAQVPLTATRQGLKINCSVVSKCQVA